MNLQNFRQNPGFLAGIAVIFVLVSAPIAAQEMASVSGRVVDEIGEGIAGVSIAVQPYKVMGNRRQEGFVELWERQTDSEGRFTITNIMPAESLRFVVKAEQKETKILSIGMDGLTLYPSDHPHFNKMQFSLEAGMEIKNAVITVKMDIRPQIRARVVFADGTPVTNTQIHTRMLSRNMDESGSGNRSGPRYTDAEGYFVEDLRVDDEPQFYVLGIEHQGFFAKTPPFILHEGQPQIHLLLTLNDKPMPLEKRIPKQVSTALLAFLDPPAVWVVNPANGHAYKKIYCHDITDAMDQATAENAYLVSINDQAEDNWLQGIFDREHFWIGLSDVAEEGQWTWHSGEPVTYTNWRVHEGDIGNTEMRDYAISGGFAGRWDIVAPGEGRASFVNTAILERSDVPVEMPSADNQQ